jgi:Zn-finger nucleic acid-binding protein
MALPCPVCRVDMQRADFRGFMLDVCPKCAGLWFDDIELRELIERDPTILVQLEDLFEPTVEAVEAGDRPRMCPHGHTYLETFRYLSDSPIEVDSCPMCYGVFIEDEELADIADYIRNEYKGEVSEVIEGLKSFEGHTVTSVGNQNEADTTYGLVHALSHWHNQKVAAGTESED